MGDRFVSVPDDFDLPDLVRAKLAANLGDPLTLEGAAVAAAAGNPPDASTTVKGIVELATSAETISGLSSSFVVTPAGLAAKVASATALGIVELATTAETTAGTDTTRAVTAAGVKAVADTKAALSHTHAAADVTSGTVATARLGSGTANAATFLRGDQTWAAPSGGGGAAWGGRHIAGRYHFNAAIGGTANANFAPVSGTLYAIPFWVPVDCTYDRIAVNLGTVGTAGALVRLGVYSVGSTGLPNALQVDAGTFDATTGTGDKNQTISVTLTAGVYFAVAVGNNAAIRIRGVGTSPSIPVNWFGETGPTVRAARYLTFTGYTTGALPATATSAGQTVVTTGDIPMIALRAS